MPVLSQRTQSAGMRAIESSQRLRRVAESLDEELDEATAPHGVQLIDLDDEDSLVTTIDRVIAPSRPATASGIKR